jgi:hypothetical protein
MFGEITKEKRMNFTNGSIGIDLYARSWLLGLRLGGQNKTE